MDIRTLKAKVGSLVGFKWFVPADVIVAVAVVSVSDALVLGIAADAHSVRALFAVPSLLFIPGYVLLATLFPRRYLAPLDADPVTVFGNNTDSAGRHRVESSRRITWGERVALSFGASVAILPLLALAIVPFSGSISREPALLGLTAFVLVGAIAATVRRNRLSKRDRFRVPYRRWTRTLHRTAFGDHSLPDRAISVVLLCSLLAATSAFGFAILAPQQGEAYTSASLLTRTESGDLTASGYPDNFTQGDSEQLLLRVANNENVEMTYSAVVQLQRVDTAGETVTITDREPLVQKRKTVAAGDTWLASHTVEPTMIGEDLRMTYYLYRGDPPASPSEETAYRTLHLWINVSEPQA